ncbi:hypothetical protein DNTS_014587 [Danionella cerebrum]|uniref:Uncharacterized protein n=1 Tax=Danionella cerebrum TaxID=2873325 RepID=A0A553Q798_9TELE|nr:hypothetical protein DNTS_014587 [Danionella translucida]
MSVEKRIGAASDPKPTFVDQQKPDTVSNNQIIGIFPNRVGKKNLRGNGAESEIDAFGWFNIGSDHVGGSRGPGMRLAGHWSRPELRLTQIYFKSVPNLPNKLPIWTRNCPKLAQFWPNYRPDSVLARCAKRRQPRTKKGI